MGYGTSSSRYRHWRLTIEPPIATLTLGGHQAGGVEPPVGSSSMDVDVELADVVQRLRFEHPEVGAVVLTGGRENAFCPGTDPPGAQQDAGTEADALLFAGEVHSAIEDAGANSGQRWLAALNGSASGPGYELALATEEILLIDDGRSTVALPGLSVHGEPPAGEALVRLVDKRGVRPDLIDLVCTQANGVRGQQAQAWGLVDRIVPPQWFAEVVRERALAAAGSCPRAASSEGVPLIPLLSEPFEGGFAYPDVRVELERDAGVAVVTLVAPERLECLAPDPGPRRIRSRWWPLAVCRQFDEALLRLRGDWPALRTLIIRTEGNSLAAAAADVALLAGFEHDWFVREVVLYWRRTLRRLERTPQSVVALIEPGSCFVGTLLELAFAADRAYMLDGIDHRRPDAPPAQIILTGMNFGPLPGPNRLTRLQRRFPGQPDWLDELAKRVGDSFTVAEATRTGLVTAAFPDADWTSRTRQVIEERSALPPDALARLTAVLRSAGPKA